MNVALEMLRKIAEFPALHESTVGRVAIVSSRLESNIDVLFGYVFNLKNEQWSIITLNIRSIQTKIDMLVQGLNQEVCLIEPKIRSQLIDVLRDLRAFIELRNSLVHGQIRPNVSKLLELLSSTEFKNLKDNDALVAADGVLRESICVARFNPKTGEIVERMFDNHEIEGLIARANEISGKMLTLRDQMKDRFDWLEINMPRSEVRKLEN